MSQPTESAAFEGSIELTIGPDPRLVRPVRLAVGGLASLAGFDVEAIEDLRIAVNELIATLIERGDGSNLTLGLHATADGTVRIEGSTVLGGAADDDDERFALSDRILSVVADDHAFVVEGDRCTAWLERTCLEWDDDGADDGAGTT